MIKLFSGTPGSGKSYHAAKIIYHRLRNGRKVICNFDINLEIVGLTGFSYLRKRIFKSKKKLRQKRLGFFSYVPNDELTVEYLEDYARKHHKHGRESQTTVIIDECALLFNSREWNGKDRMKWIKFFAMHKHVGFDFILLSQSDRLIDRQIRAFIEYDVRHRKVNNYKLFGAILGLISGGSLFACVEVWYGIREKTNFEMLRYRKRIAKIYDTFFMFGADAVEGTATEEPGESSTEFATNNEKEIDKTEQLIEDYSKLILNAK